MTTQIVPHDFSYESALQDSLKVSWRVEDLIGNGKTLDFTKPFLPDSLAGVRGIGALSDREKLVLNQIRGNSYLHIFGFVEQFILPFVLEQTQKAVHGDSGKVRALATFADEEAKHIQLFERFAEEFAKGFGTHAGVIGPAGEVAAAVLKHSRLGVALVVLHLEWLTLRHYLESVKSDEGLDPQFSSLLRHHWQEEAQHAKLDTILVDELAQGLTPEQIKQGIDDFLAIGGILEGGLRAQQQLDLEALEKHVGRTFSPAEREEITAAQVKSYRYALLVQGLEHPNFVKAVAALSADGAKRVADLAHALLQ
jgi:P-aminobenzoate N-oxygenase AurF